MEREAALEILNNIEKNNAFSNIAINESIKKRDRVDGAFVRQLVYGVLENKIYLDYYISKFLNSPIEKVKTNSLNLLRIAVYQILFMDSVPDYAAVNESVEIAKKTSKGQAPFINGVLRNVLRNKDSVKLPDAKKNPVKRLSVKYSFPQWMVKYFIDSYGMEFAKRYIASANDTPPLTIRVNTLKTNSEELKSKLSEAGFEVEDGRNSVNSLKVKGSGLLNTDEFKNGEFSVQDESSMMAVETLSPQPGEVLVDLCAAPGGKTIYAAELMKGQGRIIACDLYANKLKIVERLAEERGLENIECMEWDALKINEEFIGIADKIICDVPCSGLGVIRRKPEIKYTKTMDDIKQLCKIQYAILKNAAMYLKPGGSILYSTCTLSPAENQGVVNHFIKKHGSENYKVDTMKQLTPFQNGTDGFFICRITKI
ncbi:MAG: 16S rRNA (cytosine(967)-C(5))-methyltransferase RsmB [Firmicutes bacterium]|nr:16S rRNA (cytosine(967)-C(5))-methyltransferase RsmB [Bacillota bacterium]